MNSTQVNYGLHYSTPLTLHQIGQPPDQAVGASVSYQQQTFHDVIFSGGSLFVDDNVNFVTSGVDALHEPSMRMPHNMWKHADGRPSHLQHKHRSSTTTHGQGESSKEKNFSLNSAFTSLRQLIPTEPKNRKLSKIEILRLARSYIAHLHMVLAVGADTTSQPCLHRDLNYFTSHRESSNSDRPSPRTFVDSLRIWVKGGTGGRGLARYGGLGGRGGNVYAVCDPSANLKHLRDKKPNLRFTGGVGGDSKRHHLIGNPGEDVELVVPPGVVVRLDDGRVIGELNKPDDTVTIVSGAPGASPKNRFVQEKGLALTVTLDLKLLADIGLVGFPNAGKSTILRALSRAAPKVAAYPFTTIQPNIGTLLYEDERQIKMADLPGLIEGAHINVGMGHKFLKHVERTKLLLFMVDLHGFRLNLDSPLRSPFETIVLLMKELELYKQELVHKPAVLVLNKLDIPNSQVEADRVQHQLQHFQESLQESVNEALWPERPVQFIETFQISAKNQINTDNLKLRLREILDDLAEAKDDPQTFQDFETSLAQSLVEQRAGKRLV